MWGPEVGVRCSQMFSSQGLLQNPKLSIALGFMPNEMGSAHLQAHAATASVGDLNLDSRAFLWKSSL